MTDSLNRGVKPTVTVYPKAGTSASRAVSRCGVLILALAGLWLAFTAGTRYQAANDTVQYHALQAMQEHENEVLDDLYFTITTLNEPVRFPGDTLVRCM